MRVGAAERPCIIDGAGLQWAGRQQVERQTRRTRGGVDGNRVFECSVEAHVVERLSSQDRDRAAVLVGMRSKVSREVDPAKQLVARIVHEPEYRDRGMTPDLRMRVHGNSIIAGVAVRSPRLYL